MAQLEQVARRSSLTSLWCGLACLIFTVAAALVIWMYPFGGPDLRTDFIMFLMPGGALGVSMQHRMASGLKDVMRVANGDKSS